jgi:hypothetical protein
VVLAERATAAVPGLLVDATVKTTLLLATGKATTAGLSSLPAAALAEGVLQTMFATKLKIATAFLLMLGAALCLSPLTHYALAQRQAERTALAEPALDSGQNQQVPPRPQAQAEAAPPALAPAEPMKPEDGRTMTVTGQVLDANGRPVAESQVAVVAGPYRQHRLMPAIGKSRLLGQTKANKDGHFRLDGPQTSPTRYYVVRLFALAPGHGLGHVKLDPNAPQQAAKIQLPPEQVVRGRLVDLQGQPAADVQIEVVGLKFEGKDSLLTWGTNPWPYDPADGLAAWPPRTKTDAQGRLVLRGLGLGFRVTLHAQGDRFALQEHEVKTLDKAPAAEFQWSLAPAQVLEGQVVYSDTGQPVPRACLKIESLRVINPGQVRAMSVHGPVEGEADAQGRFRLNPISGTELRVTAFAPIGQPYLTFSKQFPWPKGAIKHRVELSLPRGVLVRGKVKEAPSGKPVAGASVCFQPRDGDLNVITPFSEGWDQAAVTSPNGEFQLAALPTAGHLLIKGPTPDYIHVEITEKKLLSTDRVGGRRFYPDALLALNLPAETKSHDVNITLRRGITLKGWLVGPDGQPVLEAQMYCHSYIPFGYSYAGQPIAIREGRFELSGCDPDGTARLFILASKEELGATVAISGKQAGGEPVTVRLDRWGSALVRFVDSKGKPLANYHPAVELILVPGIPLTGEPVLDKRPGADVASPFPRPGAPTDAQGRLTLRPLIPGATYRITDFDNGRVVKSEFKVEAGQKMELPDITIKSVD